MGAQSPELTCLCGSLGALHSVAMVGGVEAPGHAGVVLGAPAAATEGAGALSKDRRDTNQPGLHKQIRAKAVKEHISPQTPETFTISALRSSTPLNNSVNSVAKKALKRIFFLDSE